MRGDVIIAWDHIDRAEFSPDPWQSARGWRIPAGIPGLFLLGRLRSRYGRSFVALHKRQPGVVLDVHDEPFQRVVVSCDGWTAQSIVRRVTTGA